MAGHYTYEFEIPANIMQVNPLVNDYQLPGSIIKIARILIPRGHLGLAYMRMESSVGPILPAGGIQWVRGDGNEVTTIVPIVLPGPPWIIRLRGFNLDVALTHAFIVDLDID